MQRNQDKPVSYEGQYSTDVVREKGIQFLEDAHAAGKPFFLGIAPIAPHVQTVPPGHTEEQYPKHPIPAKRHDGLFADEIVPRTKNFNPNQVSIDKLSRSMGVF
jgi:N-acetylglucosamine-6-sulfatase